MNSNPTKVWVTVEEACDALRMRKTALWTLQKNDLEPGKRWVYLTGKELGSVSWDISAIADWQREQTAALFKAVRDKAAAIESYQEES